MGRTVYTQRFFDAIESYASQKLLAGPFEGHFLKTYFHVVTRDYHNIALAFEDAGASRIALDGTDVAHIVQFDDVVDAIKQLGIVDMRYAFRRNEVQTIRWQQNTFVVGQSKKTEAELSDWLRHQAREYLIVEHVESAALGAKGENQLAFITLQNSQSVSEIADAYAYAPKSPEKRCPLSVISPSQLPHELRELIEKTVIDLANYLSLYELLKFEIAVVGDSFRIVWMIPALDETDQAQATGALASFVEQWSDHKDHPTPQHKEAQEAALAFEQHWTDEVRMHHRSGMRPFMASFWAQEMAADVEDQYESIDDEAAAWAREHGWFSYRIDELGISKENYLEKVCDYDYFWLNRINSSYYAPWISDKVVTRYSLWRFKELLPDYYFVLKNINGVQRIAKLPDLPQGFEASKAGIFALLQGKGVLAVKSSYGSHGDGFMKLEYCDGQVALNEVEMSWDEAFAQIFTSESVHLISEYVETHPFMKAFYPKTVNTARITLFVDDDGTPVVGGCFGRLGHAKNGFVDNINSADGGISLEIDKTDGRIVLPEYKRINHYLPCPVHPDTGVAIEGAIPHWDMMVNTAKAVASSLPQLQYFAFDLAATAESLKIIEVNVFPDYTKYVARDAETQVFLRKKLMRKRAHFCIEETDFKPEIQDANRQFKFSVIIPFHNEEKYLRDAVDSLINQTMAFKENVQVILVDDNSTDGSAAICKDYCRQYPGNVVYVQNPRSGVSAARNTGLAQATGSLVSFLDADDKWESNVFKLAWDFFQHHEEIDLLECRGKWFEDKSGYLTTDYRFDKGSRVVDIFEEPNVVQLSAATAIFRRSAIADKRFEEYLKLGEDSRFVCEVIFDRGKFGLSKEAIYWRRRRLDGSSATQKLDTCDVSGVYEDVVGGYYEYLYEESRRRFGEVIPFVQYQLMDALRYRVSHVIDACVPDDMRVRYQKRLTSLVHQTDLDVITSLPHGSIGAICNLVKLKVGSRFEAEYTLSGADVFWQGKRLGSVNDKSALMVARVQEAGNRQLIEGDVLLPMPVNKGQLVLVDDASGKTLAKARLTVNESRSYKDMFGEYYYTRYDFSAKVSGRRLLHARFDLVTDRGTFKLWANRTRGDKKVSIDKSGMLVLAAQKSHKSKPSKKQRLKSVIKPLKSVVKRLIRR